MFAEVVSPRMKRFVAELKAAARLDVVVLIHGETGVGKEVAAQSIHRWSRRRTKPLVSLNCGALAESLIESELFGHSRGAFTGADRPRTGVFEASDSGTLFLDEIGELSERAQASLLRVLQEGMIRRIGETHLRATDFRLIAATHRDLRRASADGLFRLDLFFRLNVVPLAIPPLRHRVEDIPALSRQLLRRGAERLGVPVPSLSDAVIARLQGYHWPGNIRELENVLVRALVSADGSLVLSELDVRLDSVGVDVAPQLQDSGASTLAQAHRAFEKQYLLESLGRCGGNRSRAARALGLSRQGLYQKLRRHGLLTA